MPTFYMRDGDPIADGVDIKRVLRNLRAMSDEEFALLRSKSKAENALAKLLGARNYGELINAAKAGGGAPGESIRGPAGYRRLMLDQSVSKGERFPRELPAAFDIRWQRSAMELVDRALKGRQPGRLEFIALVGGTGCGKTVVAKHAVDTFGGRVLDVGFAMKTGMEGGKWPSRAQRVADAKEAVVEVETSSLLIYDQPAQLPVRRFMRTGDVLGFDKLPRSQQTLERYVEAYRNVHAGIPHDEPMGGLRDWVRNNPEVALVVTFASSEVAKDVLLHHCVMLGSNPQLAAKNNWYRAHVVDLESMSYEVVEGPGLLMEQGRYKR